MRLASIAVHAKEDSLLPRRNEPFECERRIGNLSSLGRSVAPSRSEAFRNLAGPSTGAPREGSNAP